jgi:hypothetical protein
MQSCIGIFHQHQRQQQFHLLTGMVFKIIVVTSTTCIKYNSDNTEEENQRLQSFLHEALLAPNNETVSNKERGV